jgi:two-component system OmpR family response regulator
MAAEPGEPRGMAKILIVDDDQAIRDVVRFALAKAGFTTEEADNGRTALERVTESPPDLVVLDILMPQLDGGEVCRRLRRHSAVPILFLSSKDDEVDRIVGLEIGGDDYLVKPFSPRELVARVRALLRRATPGGHLLEPTMASNSVLRHGRLALDVEFVRASWDGSAVALTATEFAILRTLMARPGKVYTRDNLMDGAYAVDKVVNDRTIDSHVRRLRAKFAAIGATPIETLHGFGYKLGTCD